MRFKALKIIFIALLGVFFVACGDDAPSCDDSDVTDTLTQILKNKVLAYLIMCLVHQ